MTDKEEMIPSDREWELFKKETRSFQRVQNIILACGVIVLFAQAVYVALSDNENFRNFFSGALLSGAAMLGWPLLRRLMHGKGKGHD